MVELVSQLRSTGDEIKLLQIQAAAHGWIYPPDPTGRLKLSP